MVEAVMEASNSRAKLMIERDRIAAAEAAKLQSSSESNEKERWTGDQDIKWAELNSTEKGKERERDDRKEERREMEARRQHEANLERDRRDKQCESERANREEQRDERREDAGRRDQQWRAEMEQRSKDSDRQAQDRAEERRLERKRLEVEAKRIEKGQPASYVPPFHTPAPYGQAGGVPPLPIHFPPHFFGGMPHLPNQFPSHPFGGTPYGPMHYPYGPDTYGPAYSTHHQHAFPPSFAPSTPMPVPARMDQSVSVPNTVNANNPVHPHTSHTPYRPPEHNLAQPTGEG
ncbi:hypothetical protein A4X13_0g5315 [Tilletia indica]|uniref:Uncharacterized protein n=1 Tax=Tilletia indica TaxID=43049 RepID=A0A177T996_9BASI|nr:hypothetical protein A4X13_0g5315 [Tilletia indica]